MPPFAVQGEDPIAIVGMGSRLPGDIKCPSDLWNLIETRRSAQSDVPANRFSIDNWYHPDANRKGGINAKGGYFLSQDDSFRKFEPSFFGIHPLEAASMDPQQRKLLEVVYETFESAGVTLDQVAGSQTACYVGAFTTDFSKTLSRDLEQHFPYQATGSDLTILSNRINYVFDLKGPSLTVDTACSSSLYAVHLACQGLLLRDFNAAIVAGTNIIMDVTHQLTATKLGILSPTSTCHTFDAQADGFGRAEGITAIYLKRLSNALADGNPIRGVIRSSSINTNGKGPGITHPSTLGQENVIRQAYAKAGLEFGETAYVECHGTGTPVGDPIEVAAIGNVFAPGRTAENPLLLSALKSQIGHTEGASGIAAIQKVVLSLEKRIVPATIGISQVNPEINLQNGRLKIVRTAEAWPRYAPYLRASINSFGYGGANAHAVMESAQSYFSRRGQPVPPALTTFTYLDNVEHLPKNIANSSDSVGVNAVLICSARSSTSLRQNLKSIAGIVSRCSVRDLAYTLATKRTVFQHRAFTLASSGTTQSDLDEAKWFIGTPKAASPKIAFVFTGQGAQWPRMGIELLQRFQIARETFDTLQESLHSIPERPEWTLYDALSQSASESQMMTEVTWTVTLCTAVQIALVNLFRSWSIHPTAVVGHSSGEAAAAYCAGHLTISEAIVTSYYRALALKRNPEPGIMMAVGLGAKGVKPYLHAYRTLYLACHNSPQSVTVSGDEASINEFEIKLKEVGVFARKIKSSGFANHSPFVEKAANYFQQTFHRSLQDEPQMSRRTSSIPMYSCITGDKITSENLGIDYWAKNISAPVLFDEALQRLLTVETTVDTVIEVGPHAALAGPIRQIKMLLGFDDRRLSYLPSLIRGKNGVHDVLRLAGSLFLADYPVDITAVNSGNGSVEDSLPTRHIVDLPTYQWNYEQIHWAEHRLNRELRFRKHLRHDLLGSLEPSSTPKSLLWRNSLQLSDVPWIADHMIGKSILFPASGYVAMALEAVQQSATHASRMPKKVTLHNVSIMSPIIFTENKIVESVLELQAVDSKKGPTTKFQFRISSVSSDSNWTEHSRGSISYEEKEQVILQARSKSITDEDFFSSNSSYDIYAEFKSSALNYGPCFQTLKNVHRLPKQAAEAKINMSPTRDVMNHESAYVIHPATMDGCLQAAFATVFPGSPKNIMRSYLPSEIISMTIYPDTRRDHGGHGHVHSNTMIGGMRYFEAGCQLYQEDGRLLCSIEAKFNAVEGLFVDVEGKAIPEPYQRLKWLPDIDQLTSTWGSKDFLYICSGALLRQSNALETPSAGKRFKNTRLDCLHRLIQLIVFKRPNLSILEAGYGSAAVSTASLLAVNPGVRYPSYRMFTFARANSALLDKITALHGSVPNAQGLLVDCERDWEAQGLTPNSFDLTIITVSSFEGISKLLQNCRSLVAPAGQIVFFQETKASDLTYEEWHRNLVSAGFSGVRFATAEMAVVLSTVNAGAGMSQLQFISSDVQRDLYLVSAEENLLMKDVQSVAVEMDFDSFCIPFSDIGSLPQGARIIVLAELERPILCRLDEMNLALLQTLCRLAASIVWVTSGSGPWFSLIHAMVQTIRAEVPALQLTTVEAEMGRDYLRPSAKAILLYEAGLRSGSRLNERHIVLRNGISYISRYVIDEDENQKDHSRVHGATEYGEYVPGLYLDMRKIGHPETSIFKKKESSSDQVVEKGYLRIAPLMHSLSRENAMTLRGLNSARHFSHECLGRVLQVSAGSKFRQGDLVVGLTGTVIDSDVLIREDLCISCEAERQGEQLLGLLEPVCIAWNAVVILGRLIDGEILLIHSNNLLLNLMVYRIARASGVEVLISRKPSSEMEVLKKHLQVDDKTFIDLDPRGSSDIPFADSVDAFLDTEGDLDANLINNLLASNGRLIKTGAEGRKAEGSPNTAVLSKSLTFSAFDIMAMMEKNPKAVAKLIQKGAAWIQSHEPPMPKIQLYQFQALSDAVAEASKFESSGRVGLRWVPECTVPIYHIQQTTLNFPHNGVYLLVGCLGGLGRSLSTWMENHGARNFIFLSRTADETAEAASLIRMLRKRPGVSVKVIRGDVSIREDVRRAVVAAGEGRLRGVIQAAGVFRDSRFSSMTLQEWNAVIRPKVEGTANLHEETLGQPLDFFVMTSSSIGIIGASTQSAYAAANGYLDSMARYRRGKGLPATSLSLGMVVGVGHVEQQTGLEGILRKRGSYGITEGEFLRMMEVAILRSTKGAVSSSSSSQSHHNEETLDPSIDYSLAVTGLDPTKFIGVGDTDDNRLTRAPLQDLLKDDPRLSHIVRASAQLSRNNNHLGTVSTSSSNSPSSNAQVAELFELLRQQSSSESNTNPNPSSTGTSPSPSPSISASQRRRHSLLQSLILAQISSLTMISLRTLSEESLPRPLSELGLDSIVGSEFQAWIWKTLGVRLGFLEVFAAGGNGLTLAGLVDLIDGKLAPSSPPLPPP